MWLLVDNNARNMQSCKVSPRGRSHYNALCNGVNAVDVPPYHYGLGRMSFFAIHLHTVNHSDCDCS